MRKKIIAMIPMLLGSTRIPEKNLMLVDGYPLVFYVIDACKKSKIFDDIYINSEHEIFRKVADMLEVKFYKRDSNKGGSNCFLKNNSRDCSGSRCQVHDHFIYDFLQNVECSYMIQVHTTSPLIKSETINNFVYDLVEKDYDSIFSVCNTYGETFYKDKPINFQLNIKSPTQNLEPIQTISWALSGWKKDSFMNSYEEGPTFCGKVGLFPINKVEAIDVDTEEDLFIAEACLRHKRGKDDNRYYFNKSIKGIEKDLKSLIEKDGSPLQTTIKSNNDITKVDDVKNVLGKSSWSYPVVLTSNDQVCFIQQQPGEGCRKHYHVTKDEWWIVFKGQFEWRVNSGEKVIKANEGDIVFLPKGTIHEIVCTSMQAGIRLAAGGRDMEHIYV